MFLWVLINRKTWLMLSNLCNKSMQYRRLICGEDRWEQLQQFFMLPSTLGMLEKWYLIAHFVVLGNLLNK